MLAGAGLLASAILSTPAQDVAPVDPAVALEPKDVWAAVVEHLGLYGDLRLRHESNFNLDDQPDRFRGRARLRLGAKTNVTDELAVGLRVRTGNPDDPNSPHVDFGDVFDSDSINLDRWFAEYSPDCCEGLVVTGGKFPHGFVTNPVYGEVLWDADVQPEGLAAEYGCGAVGPFESVDLYVGEYALVEQSLADEASVFVAQAAGRAELGEDTDGTLALGWYHYSNTTPDGSGALLGDNQGNAVSGGEFVSDFSVLNPILAVEHDGGRQPLVFGAEWIHNLEADISDDSGYAAGVAVGRGKKKGEWKAWYQLQRVEQDALFSAFAQDDFLLATNAATHAAGMKYKLEDNVELHLWGMASSRIDTAAGVPTADSERYQWRVRLDLNITL